MLYLHPETNVADAAIHAYENGARLDTKAGRVAVVQGRDQFQYAKALRVKALQRLARAMCSAHNS
jgi:hypothetical protein